MLFRGGRRKRAGALCNLLTAGVAVAFDGQTRRQAVIAAANIIFRF